MAKRSGDDWQYRLAQLTDVAVHSELRIGWDVIDYWAVAPSEAKCLHALVAWEGALSATIEKLHEMPEKHDVPKSFDPTKARRPEVAPR
jgi:hypothetical protein